MEPIVLHLKCIFNAPRATDEQLTFVEHDLTIKDIEYYDEIGWKHYREEHFIEKKLPELSEPVWFRYHDDIVIEIKGRKYLFGFSETELDQEELAMEKGKTLILTPTDKPVTIPDCTIEPDWRRAFIYKFFGQPTWVQNDFYPLDLNGKPCYHLVTIENGWGDSGNYNILIGLDENDIPNVAYFEASCC